MAQDIGELVYKISADVSGLGAQIKTAQSQIESLGKTVEKMSAQQSTSIFKGVAAWDLLKKGIQKTFGYLKGAVQEGLEDISKLNQTKAILESQGKAWSQVGQQVTDFGNRMLKMGIDDETAELQVARFSQRLSGDLRKSFEMATLAADLAASGFGTFQETSEDLERVLSGKGSRSLIKYGVALKANATISEQLAAVQKRVTITAEEAANTTSGSLRRIGQAQEEVKSAFGKGIILAFSELVKKTGDASAGFMSNEQDMKTLSKVAFQLANAVIAVGAAAAAAVEGLSAIPTSWNLLGDESKKAGIKMRRALAEAGGDWAGVEAADRQLESLSKKQQDRTKSLGDLGNTIADTYSLMNSALSKASGEGFEQLNEQLADNDKKLASASLKAKELTQAQIDAAEAADKQGKAMDTLKSSVLDARDKIVDLARSIKNELTNSFNGFKKSLADTIKTSTEDLTGIVVQAESDIKDLQEQLADEQKKSFDKQSQERIESLQAEISQKQAILTASGNFQTRLQEEIAARQKAIDDLTKQAGAETDPAKQAALQAQLLGQQTALDQLKGIGNFQQQLTDARAQAAKDEFTQAADEMFKRINLATTEFITETTQLNQKLVIAKQVESDITEFYSDNLTMRQANLDAFAVAEIATLQRIGTEANSAISALNSLQSVQARAAAPGSGNGKALGGYTAGGEFVHAGEWVMPAWMVNTFGGLVSRLEAVRSGSVSTRTINAPISINANVDGQVDFRAIGREMAWELSRL